MSSDDRGYLEDILESARLVLAYVEGYDLDAFRADQKTQDAVVYRIGIIGEAARSVSESTQKELLLDWSAIIAMRHRLFHGYREVKPAIVWSTATEDLAPLISAIEAYLK